MRERTFLVNGFSKAYAMTGWRMGYLCGPEPLIRAALKIHQFGIMSSPTTSQFAAIEALENGDEDVAMMREKYNMRRKFLLRTFEELGIPCFEPLGAFYVFPNFSRFGMSSEDFCRRFLEEEKVAMVPGSAFGDSGEGFARISYAYSMEHLQLAMDRLKKFISRLE
jgi:aminotransferase